MGDLGDIVRRYGPSHVDPGFVIGPLAVLELGRRASTGSLPRNRIVGLRALVDAESGDGAQEDAGRS